MDIISARKRVSTDRWSKAWEGIHQAFKANTNYKIPCMMLHVFHTYYKIIQSSIQNLRLKFTDYLNLNWFVSKPSLKWASVKIWISDYHQLMKVLVNFTDNVSKSIPVNCYMLGVKTPPARSGGCRKKTCCRSLQCACSPQGPRPINSDKICINFCDNLDMIQ